MADNDKQQHLDDLRRRALASLNREASAQITLQPEAVTELLEELYVHQIELELQNEDLQRVQQELEHAYVAYKDIFDFAPVGYFILNELGLILQVNTTG